MKRLTLISLLAIFTITGIVFIREFRIMEKVKRLSREQFEDSNETDDHEEDYGEPEEEEENEYDNPGQFALYNRITRTRIGESGPGYKPGYQHREYSKALAAKSYFNARSKAYTWKERGPANVPGRTRGIVILPGDPAKNTWIAGSVGGGIWKTKDGGKTWVNKTPDEPNRCFLFLEFCTGFKS